MSIIALNITIIQDFVFKVYLILKGIKRAWISNNKVYIRTFSNSKTAFFSINLKLHKTVKSKIHFAAHWYINNIYMHFLIVLFNTLKYDFSLKRAKLNVKVIWNSISNYALD